MGDTAFGGFVVVVLSAVLLAPIAGLVLPSGSFSGDSYPLHLRSSALTSHAPILITGDSDFVFQGWPGSGTLTDPYVISSLEINASSSHGIRVQDTSAHFVIRDSHVFDGRLIVDDASAFDGVSLYNVANSRVENVTAENCRYGVSVFFSHDVVVSAITATQNNFSGICVHQSVRAVVENSTSVQNLRSGILVGYSANCTVQNNTVTDTGAGGWHFEGVRVWSSENVSVLGNSLARNGNSVMLDQSYACVVSGNTMAEDSGQAIYLYFTEHSSATGNTVTSSYACVAVQGSGNNSLYHNNFYSTAVMFYEPGTTSFDNGYPDGGNYWWNYGGNDLKSGPGQYLRGPDGIRDAPIAFDENNSDRYPLMAPFPTNRPPVAVLEAAPQGGDLSMIFAFEARLSWDYEDPVSALEVRWDWEGDGIWDTSWSTAKTVTHTYLVQGRYTAYLEVRDSEGLTGNDSIALKAPLGNVAPVAKAGNDRTVEQGDQIWLDGSESSDDSDPVADLNFTWSISVGVTTVTLYGSQVSYVFDKSGTYTATLSVRDSSGLIGTDEVVVTVEPKASSFLAQYWWAIAVLALAVIFAIAFLLMKRSHSSR